MTPDELRRLRILSFLQLAREELDVALEIKANHRRQAAYFLQQSVEKLLRGVLETEAWRTCFPMGTTCSSALSSWTNFRLLPHAIGIQARKGRSPISMRKNLMHWCRKLRR